MKTKNNNYKREFLKQIKSYLLVNGPIIISVLFLFVRIPIKLVFLKGVVIWIAFLISSILIVARKEYPMLPPYKSVTGRSAMIMGYVFFSIVIVTGILYIILEYIYP
jgi:hypothetical protein